MSSFPSLARREALPCQINQYAAPNASVRLMVIGVAQPAETSTTLKEVWRKCAIANQTCVILCA